jgi:hypothetical protein
MSKYFIILFVLITVSAHAEDTMKINFYKGKSGRGDCFAISKFSRGVQSYDVFGTDSSFAKLQFTENNVSVNKGDFDFTTSFKVGGDNVERSSVKGAEHISFYGSHGNDFVSCGTHTDIAMNGDVPFEISFKSKCETIIWFPSRESASCKNLKEVNLSDSQEATFIATKTLNSDYWCSDNYIGNDKGFYVGVNADGQLNIMKEGYRRFATWKEHDIPRYVVAEPANLIDGEQIFSENGAVIYRAKTWRDTKDVPCLKITH